MAGISPGRIFTFYSYKGGTGRSMTMANVAWILAASGKRVLVVDWDLEAPGLHRYFQPFLADGDLNESPGIIDMVTDFSVEAMTPVDDDEQRQDWYLEHANILRYASSLEWRFRKPGTLDFVSAGRQGASYGARVNSFNWENFYDRLGGGVFLEAVKDKMRLEYDYTLIDSRTGVSDTSGICTVQMPDALVVCFTLNRQSIEGASAIAISVREHRGADGFPIFPVPMRVEDGEQNKLELARDHTRQRFDPFLGHLGPQRIDDYWGRVEGPYKRFYAYEEILAPFGDRPGQSGSMLAFAERLTGYLTDGEITGLAPMKEPNRRKVLATFERSPRRKGSDIFLSHASGDRDSAEALARALEQRGWSVWSSERAIKPGQSVAAETEAALRSAECVVVLWSHESVASDWVLAEAQVAVERGVLIPVAIEDAELPLDFVQYHTIVLNGLPREPDPGVLESLYSAVAERVGKQPVEGGMDTAPASSPVAGYDSRSPRRSWMWLAAAGVILGVAVTWAIWNYGFKTDGSTPGGGIRPEITPRSRLDVTASTESDEFRPGKPVPISIVVLSPEGRPVEGAAVSIKAGGGFFASTTNTVVAGATDAKGVFRAAWSCKRCAPSYEFSVRATSPDHRESTTSLQLTSAKKE